MSQAVSTDQTPSTSDAPNGRRARMVLFAWWLLVICAISVIGQRPGSLADLLDAVDAGQASEIAVTGVFAPGTQGYGSQDVRWRQGPSKRHAVVMQATPGNEQEARNNRDRSATTTSRSVAVLVHERDPAARVHESEAFSPGSSSVLGWEVPGWLQASFFVSLVASLLLIINGPEPWRATRWAWAWAVLATGPLGALLFAVLSGPTPMVKAPRGGARRLRGGWAFVLLTLLGPFLPAR